MSFGSLAVAPGPRAFAQQSSSCTTTITTTTMEPSSKRRRLAPKVADPPVLPPHAPASVPVPVPVPAPAPPHTQAQPPPHGFPQEQVRIPSPLFTCPPEH